MVALCLFLQAVREEVRESGHVHGGAMQPTDTIMLSSLWIFRSDRDIWNQTYTKSPVEEREKERGRGSNLRRQRLGSPTAQVLVAQTTQPVQNNRLHDELQSYVRTDTVDWGLGGGRKKEKKQAE